MKQLFRLIAAALRLPINEINPGTAMKNTVAWDSLAHMELVVGIEEHYQIILDANQIADMTSVAGIVEHFEQRGLLRDES